MESKSNLPTHSTWDQDDDQLEADNNLNLEPGTAMQPNDQNDSYNESPLSEDSGDDDELYGPLQAAYSTGPTLCSNLPPWPRQLTRELAYQSLARMCQRNY